MSARPMMKSPAARRRKEEGERGGKGEGELGDGTVVMLVSQHHPDRRPPPHHSIVRLGALSADASCQLDVLKNEQHARVGTNSQHDGSRRQVQTEKREENKARPVIRAFAIATQCQSACMCRQTLGMMVTRLAWMAHRFVSIRRRTSDCRGKSD